MEEESISELFRALRGGRDSSELVVVFSIVDGVVWDGLGK
jgi:hypothetical protein